MKGRKTMYAYYCEYDVYEDGNWTTESGWAVSPSREDAYRAAAPEGVHRSYEGWYTTEDMEAAELFITCERAHYWTKEAEETLRKHLTSLGMYDIITDEGQH